MTEAAIIRDKPNFWQWGRWPTHYDDLNALGIDPAKYDFKPLPDLLAEVQQTSGGLILPSTPSLRQPATSARSWKDSIDRHKTSLAAELGVDVDTIEIAVRM
jgi:hypothetical protein